MKRYYFLGLTPQGNACILKSLVPFDALDPSDLNTDDFKHAATNWGGQDRIERTIELLNKNRLKDQKAVLTGRAIMLSKPLEFHGSDYDCGHTSPWVCNVVKIAELELKESEKDA